MDSSNYELHVGWPRHWDLSGE